MPDIDWDHPANYCHQQHNFMKRWICVYVIFFWSTDVKQCKKLREGNLRRNMQCLLERRIYLDVKSDREGFELTFIKLLGMDICLFQTRIMKLNSTFKFKFSRVGEGGNKLTSRSFSSNWEILLTMQNMSYLEKPYSSKTDDFLEIVGWRGGNFLFLKNHLL